MVFIYNLNILEFQDIQGCFSIYAQRFFPGFSRVFQDSFKIPGFFRIFQDAGNPVKGACTCIRIWTHAPICWGTGHNYISVNSALVNQLVHHLGRKFNSVLEVPSAFWFLLPVQCCVT